MGHAMIASWLLWSDTVDEVWMAPTFDHAFGKRLAPWDLRVAMCREIAALVGKSVSVCEVERELPTPSYTLKTLEHLSALHPSRSFRLVVGADVLGEVGEWHRWDEIERRFDPVILGRVGYPEVAGAPMFQGVSSTEIRRLLANGGDVGHLLPKGVLEIARRHYSEGEAR